MSESKMTDGLSYRASQIVSGVVNDPAFTLPKTSDGAKQFIRMAGLKWLEKYGGRYGHRPGKKTFAELLSWAGAGDKPPTELEKAKAALDRAQARYYRLLMQAQNPQSSKIEAIRKRAAERGERIFNLREQGKTFPEIGKAEGICTGAAREIYLRTKKRKSA